MTVRSPVNSGTTPDDGSAYQAQSADVTTALISAQVIRQYLRYLKSKKAAETTMKTASSVLNGVAWRTETDILTTGEEGLRRWQELRAEQLNPRALRTQITYVRGFYRWAAMTGLIEHDPSWVLEPPRVSRLLPHPMPDEDVGRALAAAEGDMLAILGLAGFGGARACEVAALDWADVVLTGRRPRMRLVGKGGHERVIDIAPPLHDALAALPHRTGPVIRRRDGRPGRVKPTRISQLANEFLDEQGIKERLHGLRHRFGSRVYEESRDLRATQESLGHMNPATTAGYAALAVGSMRNAILAAGRLRPDDEDDHEPPLTAPASL